MSMSPSSPVRHQRSNSLPSTPTTKQLKKDLEKKQALLRLADTIIRQTCGSPSKIDRNLVQSNSLMGLQLEMADRVQNCIAELEERIAARAANSTYMGGNSPFQTPIKTREKPSNNDHSEPTVSPTSPSGSPLRDESTSVSGSDSDCDDSNDPDYTPDDPSYKYKTLDAGKGGNPGEAILQGKVTDFDKEASLEGKIPPRKQPHREVKK